MKNLITRILPFILALAPAVLGFSQNKDPVQKLSLDDGINVRGKIMTIAHLRNLTALEMILGCMDSGADRYYCQCSVDNTFLGMSAEEILERDVNKFLKPRAEAAKKLCQNSPKEKIPKTVNKNSMLGDEIRSFILKEMVLDGMGIGKDETSSRCFANEMAASLDNPMRYLKIIDTRQYNMFEYIVNDEATANKARELRQTCKF